MVHSSEKFKVDSSKFLVRLFEDAKKVEATFNARNLHKTTVNFRTPDFPQFFLMN